MTASVAVHLPETWMIPPIGQIAIDHIAHTGELIAESIFGLSNIGPDGTPLSDHFGIAAGLRLRKT